jgi:ABC-2 type transport system ATP-binding protein
MIEVRGLTKRFGDTLAVDNLSFQIPPGVVTGFLGPNGAGKSTTMRMILGLDRPTHGSALINGRPYQHSRRPMHEVGALLDAKDVHGGRSARSHLRALAYSNGIPARRVEEVLELVGLEAVAGRRIKGFSLGMSQRLGIAGTMLGNPQVLLFDEPVNGLDPEGILWIRNFMKSLAAEGRTVFVSSHLMSEMALTADHLIVIGRGKLIADVSTKEFIAGGSTNHVRVRTPHEPQLVQALSARGITGTRVGDYLEVRGITCAEVGDLAAANQVTIHELFEERASLEEAFMELTRESVEYHAPSAEQPATGAAGQEIR